MQRILVLRGGALGDFLVTLPALAALRRQWPDAKIELIGNATAAALARARGLVDAVHSQHEARWSAFFADAPLPAALVQWLEHFDLVLNYWPDPGHALRRRFPLRPGQLFLSAPALPSHGPAAAHYSAPLRELGIEVSELIHPLSPMPEVPKKPLGAEAESSSSRTPRSGYHPGAVAIHPGSGSSRKNWPLDRWLELCGALRSAAPAGDLLIVTGEADAAAATVLAGAGRHAHLWPLETLIREFSAARLFVGHDSGLSHLAAASGVPCLLLFGPTDPSIWAPPAPHAHVIRRGSSLEPISVAEVQAEATRILQPAIGRPGPAFPRQP